MTINGIENFFIKNSVKVNQQLGLLDIIYIILLMKLPSMYTY